jgi:Uri superfamily endonuclease
MGFGASDCGCHGHLFRLGERSIEGAFARRACRALGARPVAKAELDALMK